MSDKDINKPQAADESNRPRKRMPKWLRYTLISLGVILALLIIGALILIIWLGPIVESYVERNDKELVGRRIEMDDLRIRLFDGTATADNIILYEADEQTPFASIDRMEVDMAVGEIFDNHIHITRVHLTRPYLSIVQDGEIFNFDDMVEYIFVKYILPTAIEEQYSSEAEGDEWKITIENLTFEDGHIEYLDREIDQRWSLTAMNLHADEFHMEDVMSTIDATLLINKGAKVEGTLLFNYDSFDFDFRGTLDNFNLSDTYKYWTPYLNIASVEGIGEATAHITGNVSDIWAMDIGGEFTITDGVILGPDGGNILSAKSISGSLKNLNIEHERYIFDTLYASQYATQFIFNADGSTNFSGLFPEDTYVSVETTAESLGGEMYDVREEVVITANDDDIIDEMVIKIGDMQLTEGTILYADNTLHEPFNYNISNASIKAKNLDLDGVNDITIEANVPKQGKAMIHWEGGLEDFYNQNIMMILSNVDIATLEPYIKYYTAFPVESGNLTFRSQNTITNGELNGINQLGTYNFKLSKRDKSMEVEYKLPLRAAVYILTDKDDHIDIELPVSGNIESPEFSYKRTILKAIGNLLLKVVAAPFDWMSGDKQDAFRNIGVEILEPGLTAEQYARIDKLVEALGDDQTLSVRLTHDVNYKRATQQIADFNLKIAYYNSQQSNDSERLDMLDFSKIKSMRLSNKDVHAFADSLLMERGIDASQMTSHAKARALYGDMIDDQLIKVMEHRNNTIAEYIRFHHPELREGALAIDAIERSKIVGNNGRNRYNVTLIIDGEEIPVNSDDDDATQEEEDIFDLENNN